MSEIESSKALREQGNAFFKEGKWVEAATAYSSALQAAVPSDLRASFAKSASLTALPIGASREDASLALSNRAACWLKQSRFEAAAADCTAVLEADGGNAKALFRRAQAYQGLGQIRQALLDAGRLLQLDPSNAGAASLMRELRVAATSASSAAAVGAAAASGAAASATRGAASVPVAAAPRAGAGSGAAASAGSSALSPSSAAGQGQGQGQVPRLPFGEAMELLVKAASQVAAEQERLRSAAAAAAGSSASVGGFGPALLRICATLLASLPPALRGSGNARAFLSKGGPQLLMQVAAAAAAASASAAAATADAPSAAAGRAPPTAVQRALSVIMGLCRSIVAPTAEEDVDDDRDKPAGAASAAAGGGGGGGDFGAVWGKEWLRGLGPGCAEWRPPAFAEGEAEAAFEAAAAAQERRVKAAREAAPSAEEAAATSAALPRAPSLDHATAATGPELSLPAPAKAMLQSLGGLLGDALLPVLAAGAGAGSAAGAAAGVAASAATAASLSPHLPADDAFRGAASLVGALCALAGPFMAGQSAAWLHAVRKAEAARHKAEQAKRRAAGTASASAPAPGGVRLLPFVFVCLPPFLRGPLLAWVRWCTTAVLLTPPRTTAIAVSTGPQPTPASAATATAASASASAAASAAASASVRGVPWDYATHDYTLRALAQLLGLGGEEGVWLLHAGGATDAALALTAALPADVGWHVERPGPGSVALPDRKVLLQARKAAADSAAAISRTAAGVLTRALATLRDAHPAGYGETGRAKERALLMDLLHCAGIDDLSRALPLATMVKAAPASASSSSAAVIDADGDADDDAAEGAGAGAGAGSGARKAQVRLLSDDSAPAPAPASSADWTPRESAARATALLHCALLADRSEGLQLCEEVSGALPSLYITTAAPATHWQLLALEVVSALANDEPGRTALAGAADRIAPAALAANPSARARLDSGALLARLMEARSPAVRGAASITLAKLSAPAKVWAQAPAHGSAAAGGAGAGSAAGSSGADAMVAAVLDELVAAAGISSGPTVAGKRGPAAIDEGDELEGEEEEHEAAAAAAGRVKVPFTAMLLALEEGASGAGGAQGGGGDSAGRIAVFGSAAAAPVTIALPSQPSPASTASSSSAAAGPRAPAVARFPVLAQWSPVDLPAACRVVEALAVMATHTRTKVALSSSPKAMAALLRVGAAICAGLGVTAAAIGGPRPTASTPKGPSAAAAAASSMGSPGELRPALFGLAFIVFSLTTSRQRQREEKLAEMEMDVAQYRELQRLANPNPGRAPGAAADPDDGSVDDEGPDPQTAVHARVASLVLAEAVPLMAALVEASRLAGGSAGAAGKSKPSAAPASGPAAVFPPPSSASPSSSSGSSAVPEVVSRTLLNMAEAAAARGPMMAAGITKLLLTLTGVHAPSAASGSAAALAPVSNSQAGAMAAAHALGRCLITTNPSSLPPAQAADAVQPLLRVLRESTGQLAMFEATMGLTNLLSGSEEARARVLDAKRGGLDAVEFVQFSEHKMLRRSATEALTNLAATEEGSRLILRSRLGLWLALARGYERPEPGAADAAAGSGASAAAVPKGKPTSATAAMGPTPPPPSLSSPEVQARLKALQSGRGSASSALAGESGGGDDTPTAMAAAGALAMALLHVVGQAGAEEGGDEEEAAALAEAAARARGRGAAVHGSLKEAIPAQVKAQRAARAAARAAAAEAAINRLADAAAHEVVGELLLSGQPGLLQRALVIAGEMAKYDRGIAALLAPLAGSDAPADGAPSAAAEVASVSVLTLLLLLAEGKDPATLAATGLAAAGGAVPATIPPPLRSLAAAAAVRVLEPSTTADGRTRIQQAAEATPLPAAADKPAKDDDEEEADAGDSRRRTLRPVFPNQAFSIESLAACRKAASGR